MRAYDIILKKRNGLELSSEEIQFLIDGYVKGTIPDYQMAAFCMAVFFRGLNPGETSVLTRAMADSGDRVDLSEIPGIKVDKHSTGGVGDKTTMIVVPLVACLGVPVAKMSGRGLGHTGGTVDKLESIPGFRTDLPIDEFIQTVKNAGAALIGQTGNLVPADKKIYALRDVTATVDSIPLIASSIMSKKIAAGCDALVLDVKVGSGAFMKNKEEARKLANLMLDIGRAMQIRTAAVLSSANQPLGKGIGNSLEVKEAVETLQGNGPGDLKELCIQLAAQMLLMGKGMKDQKNAVKQVTEALESGAALNKFREIIEAQGGNSAVVEDTTLLPNAELTLQVTSPREGYIQKFDTEKVGLAAACIGAGRSRKEDKIDPSAGIVMHKKIGDTVFRGEPLATLHFNSGAPCEQASDIILDAVQIGRERPASEPLIIDIIS
jgi:pyrimidine-nucleoside phosphorylase